VKVEKLNFTSIIENEGHNTMEYLIRFTQVHETFRLAEIEALAVLEDISLKIVSYSPTVGLSLALSSLQTYAF
jgi:tRNA G10  N-methylase Trm11